MNQADQLALSLTSEVEGWNPRYAVYASAHGLDPGAMLARDCLEYPGGKMCGFILWTGARWREWRKLRGMKERDPLFPEHHAAFDFWIANGHPLPVLA